MFTDNLTLKHASERELLSDVTYTQNFTEDEYFIMYIKSGKAQLILNKTLYKISGGCFVLCRGAGIRYRFSKRFPAKVYTVSFSGENNILPAGVYRCADKSSAEKALDTITTEFILKKKNCNEMLSALTENLLVILSRSIEKETDVDKAIDALAKDIHQNYLTDKIDVGKYAKQVNLSKDRLSVIFKKHFGLAPYKYQLMLKMNDATDLLLQTDLPIGKIAEKLGFSTQLYFSSAYKKQIGMTPSEMRKNRKPH